MDTCKLCGGEFKNLGVHVTKKHKITMDAYRALNVKSQEEQTAPDTDKDLEDDGFSELSEEELAQLSPAVDAPVGPEPVTTKSRQDAIWNSEKGKLLSDFLLELGIDEQELRQIIKQNRTGGVVPVAQQLKNRELSAEKIARENADKPEIRTEDCYIASALKNKFGYTCLEVIGHKDKDGDVKTKTWVLQKIKQ